MNGARFSVMLAVVSALVMLYYATDALMVIADAQIALASDGCYEVPERSYAERNPQR